MGRMGRNGQLWADQATFLDTVLFGKRRYPTLSTTCTVRLPVHFAFAQVVFEEDVGADTINSRITSLQKLVNLLNRFCARKSGYLAFSINSWLFWSWWHLVTLLQKCKQITKHFEIEIFENHFHFIRLF